jgi:hypothetical protein
MRGAVLYKLGLDFVKDRIMRRNYGVAMNVVFRPGYHPAHRRITGLDGVVRCENVMDWYGNKVYSLCYCFDIQNQRITSGAVTEHPFFRMLSVAEYNRTGPILHNTELLVSELENAPEYYEPPQGSFSLSFSRAQTNGSEPPVYVDGGFAKAAPRSIFEEDWPKWGLL